MNFFIGIPTINRADLLNESLKKYVIDFPDVKIIVIDNGNQRIWEEHDNVLVFSHGKNIGVAGSWNWFLKENLGIWDNALILNDDIYLGKNQDDISAYLELCEDADLILGEKCHWSVMLIRKRLVESIGYFDENFYPAYFEDNDFNYRLNLKGHKVERMKALTPEIYRNSMTIKKDPMLNSKFAENRQYYIRKWGGLPNQETFKTPFNK